MKADCTFFSNVECEYFPCHGLAEQNCLFCYCPLYAFDCGGNFSAAGDVKDCSRCAIVHDEAGYEYVQKKLKELRLTFFEGRLNTGSISTRND